MTDVTEENIINTLEDLRQLKADLASQEKERVKLDDDIQGLQSDVESTERTLQEQIKAFTDGGEARPGW